MKNKITNFDLEAAFKALDDLEMPRVGGVLPNRVNLQESFKKVDKFDLLFEDYYDVNDPDDLAAAQENREDEIAKAKLARIEKIVDLDAASPEDIQPSYIGKIIVQCPQCMTLFYKDEADLVYDEENDKLVNVGEKCQHCGNLDGYSVEGKVGEVSADEMANFEGGQAEEAPAEELPTKATPDEEAPAEAPAEESNEEAPLDLNLEAPAEEEEKPEDLKENLESNEFNHAEQAIADDEGISADNYADVCPDCGKEVCECGISLNESGHDVIAEINAAVRNFDRGSEDNLEEAFDDEELAEDLGDYEVCPKCGRIKLKNDVKFCHNGKCCNTIHCELTEDVDTNLNKELKEYAEYIERLQKDIAELEKKLANESNSFVKESIQKTIDSLKADLEAAIPEKVKGKAAESDNDLPDLNELPNEAIEGGEEPVEDNAEPAENKELKEEVNADIAYNQGKQSAKDMIDDYNKLEGDEKEKNKAVIIKKYTKVVNKEEKSDAERGFLEVIKPLVSKFYEDEQKLKDAKKAEKAAEREAKKAEKAAAKKSKNESLALREEDEVSDADIEELINSKEFATPISDAEVESILDKSDEIDDLDECSMNEHLTAYLTEVYSNVKDFVTTDCSLDKNCLVVEGVINFNSGKQKTTKFNFDLKSRLTEGFSKELNAHNAFKLNYTVKDHKLFTESIKYNYSINGSKVTGIK